MQPCEHLDGANFIGKLLDKRNPFSIHFCIREVNLTKWHIVHHDPTDYHVLYVPEYAAIVGSVDGAPVTFRPGQAAWIQPGVVWELSHASGAQALTIGVCRFELRGEHPPRLHEPLRVGRTTVRDVLMEELMHGYEAEATVEPLRQRAVLARILCQTFFMPPAVEAVGGLGPRTRAQALSYMIRHTSERYTVRDIAAHVRMNPDYFSRLFHVSFGSSPKRVIMEMRIRAAGHHLRMSSDTISETASRFGYNSVFLFSRQFKDVHGVSPSEWLTQSAT